MVQNQYPVLTSSQQQGIVLQEDYFADRQVTTNDNIGYYVLPLGYFTYRSRSDTDVFVFNRNNLINKGIISYYYPVFRPNNADSNFLLRRLNHGIKSQLSMAAEGTGQRVLAHGKFKNMEFLLPSLPEQKLIGNLFERIDNLITLHQRELFETFALCKLMLLPPIQNFRQTATAIQRSTLINTWEQRKLGEVFEEYSEKGHPEYPALTIIQGSGTIRRDESDRSLQYDKASLANYKVVHAGDFIVHLRSFEGGLEKATTLGIISPAYHTFHGEGTDYRFYYSYFRSPKFIHKDLKPHVYGIRDGRSIDISGMKTIEIPWTSLAEQRAIGNCIESLDNLITLHQRKSITLKNIKNAFLERMLGVIYGSNCIIIETEMDSMDTFRNETDFENALIQILTSTCGWEKKVLEYKTEKDLLQNWAAILFENNRSIDRLNDYPLTDGEMQQILEQINTLRTPLRLNGFINGRSVSIKRDNPNDQAHFGKEISLKIYDRQEIAAGQSRYQIARQPKFSAKSNILPDRRGDFMLLINGMPVIHVELKKSGIPISQAYNQIEKYAKEGIFTGLFSLVQVFVAMNPDEAVYFANPGPEGRFNTDFYFHWANFNNDPINDWKTVASTLLSIPMAHELIGYYTVADTSDGILKVMRSYQYFAANKISDTVSKHKWEYGGQRGGYIWHTTGSGKTMTSFKSAQLIASSKDADKVVFLIDRIELGTQSATEYRGFAEESDEIQETEDSTVLGAKLKSNDPANTLIVTSVQKMSNIGNDEEAHLKKADLEAIQAKRIVFIVDECHRSTFGDMMQTIKHTFPKALFFGFSGTPIQLENEKKGNTTADVFGNELHRYSIADGIRDRNVLGFDPDKVLTFKEKDIREAVALDKAKATTVAEVFADPKKKQIYYQYLHDVPMAGFKTADGKYVKGIEDFLVENGQYRTDEHQKMVVQDILDNWISVSHNYKFHAIFATSSIPEAVQYYKRFKAEAPDLKVAILFDPSIDNSPYGMVKEDALVELIQDYNVRYHQTFTIPTWPKMKKDIQARLAHKKPYERIENDRGEQIDLLIVVDQMLTGYDSKWVNALYLDKMLQYENIIQAFSRTNRLFGPDKPFGTIKYYRAPYSMERNIDAAVKLYSGDKPLGMFAVKLDKNLENLNAVYTQIHNLFKQAGIEQFEHLPNDITERRKFAKLFKELNEYLEAAKVQGFAWEKLTYEFPKTEAYEARTVTLLFDETTYRILALRYKELFTEVPVTPGGDLPYDLIGYLTTIDTDEIDADYMNSRFEKYRKALTAGDAAEINAAREELHRTFATLTQEEQKYANIFLHDIQTGDVKTESGKTLRDYINEYMQNAKNDQIHRLARALGLNADMLRKLMTIKVDETTINEYNRLTDLKATVDKARAKAYFEATEGIKLPLPLVNTRIDKLLRSFILQGGFDIVDWNGECGNTIN